MNILSLSKILKGGSIAAADVALSGQLRPEVAHNFVNAIKDNSKFLQKITVKRMKKLSMEIDAWDVAKGILVRVPSGQTPTDEQRRKLDLIGTNLEGKSVQLFARILKDALNDNQDNPNFEKEQYDAFTKAFGNDLALLGFVGERDDYANKEFKELNKGWIQVARESNDVNKKTYTKSTKVIDRLTVLVDEIHDDVFDEAVILISPKDYRAYNKEISNLNVANILINGDARQILGVPLEVQPLMKSGEYLATPLKNLILGVGVLIDRNRYYDNEERALKYIFDTFCDYEIVIKKWASLLTAEIVVLSLTATTKSVAVGSTVQVTTTAEDLTKVTATSSDVAKATVSYNNTTGVIQITGVAAGSATITVTDGTTTKTIAVTVTA